MYTIEQIKKKAVPIAQRYQVDSLSLFGSYARNEQNEKSDIDFLIEKGEIKNLFQYVRFFQELEKEFGCHVDVVTTGIKDENFLNKINKERKLLYARQR